MGVRVHKPGHQQHSPEARRRRQRDATSPGQRDIRHAPAVNEEFAILDHVAAMRDHQSAPKPSSRRHRSMVQSAAVLCQSESLYIAWVGRMISFGTGFAFQNAKGSLYRFRPAGRIDERRIQQPSRT